MVKQAQGLTIFANDAARHAATVSDWLNNNYKEGERLLVKYGAKGWTGYWPDISFGHLYEAYTRVADYLHAVAAAKNAVPALLRSIPCTLESGDVVQLAHGLLLTSAAPVEAGPNEGKVQIAWDDAKLGERRGWVPEAAVVPAAWYKANRRFEILSEADQVVGAVAEGELFMVVARTSIPGALVFGGGQVARRWRLGDGRGEIVVEDEEVDVDGPARVPEAVSPNKLVAENGTMTSDKGKYAGRVRAAGNSKWALGARLVGGATMFGLGPVTGGVTWAIWAGVTLADTIISAGLEAAGQRILANRAASFMAALAAEEYQLFAAPDCGEGKECGDGQACLRQGVFFHSAKGRCVDVDRAQEDSGAFAHQLQPLEAACVVHEDCASSYCGHVLHKIPDVLTLGPLHWRKATAQEAALASLTGTCEEAPPKHDFSGR